MVSIDPIAVINLVLFIVPGYIVLYIVGIFTDYLYEKNQFEKIIQYLVFSAFSYTITLIILFFFICVVYLIESLGLNLIIFDDLLNVYILIGKNPLILTLATIFISVFIGKMLGENYFGKGYPHKHFKEITKRNNSPSIYSFLISKKFKVSGAWITCYLKDDTIISGKLIQYDLDEESKNYIFGLDNVQRYFSNTNEIIKLECKRIIIVNVRETRFIEFSD